MGLDRVGGVAGSWRVRRSSSARASWPVSASASRRPARRGQRTSATRSCNLLHGEACSPCDRAAPIEGFACGARQVWRAALRVTRVPLRVPVRMRALLARRHAVGDGIAATRSAPTASPGGGSSSSSSRLIPPAAGDPRRPICSGLVIGEIGLIDVVRSSCPDHHHALVLRFRRRRKARRCGTVKLVSGAAEADDLGVDTQPEGPSWARCRTRVTGIRRRSSRTACGCITGSR